LAMTFSLNISTSSGLVARIGYAILCCKSSDRRSTARSVDGMKSGSEVKSMSN
jgi:hypothetical protein